MVSKPNTGHSRVWGSSALHISPSQTSIFNWNHERKKMPRLEFKLPLHSRPPFYLRGTRSPDFLLDPSCAGLGIRGHPYPCHFVRYAHHQRRINCGTSSLLTQSHIGPCKPRRSIVNRHHGRGLNGSQRVLMRPGISTLGPLAAVHIFLIFIVSLDGQ